MRTLIIEDEPRAANQLKRALQDAPFDFELLDIIDTVEESILWFRRNTNPDLIFMDIQLADGLSFEIFQHVKIETPIIFTTAFDQYAIQAFKVNSIDYLLKPIQNDDLNQALTKYQKSIQPQSLNTDVLKSLLGNIQNKSKRKGILVKEGAGFIQLKLSEITYIYSQDSITFGLANNKRYIIEETLDKLYETMDQDDFFKINRGQLIAKSSIIKIEPYFNHRVKLIVKNPRDFEFIVSRQKTAEFKEWMNR